MDLYLSGYFLGTSCVFSGYFMGVPSVLQEYSNVIHEYVMGMSRVFLGCFCPIEFALVAALTSAHKRKPF